MELSLFTVIISVTFAGLISLWAKSLNRNPTMYFVLSLLISPLLTGVILLFKGKDNGEEDALLREQYIEKYLAKEDLNSESRSSKEMFEKLIEGAKVETGVLKVSFAFLK